MKKLLIVLCLYCQICYAVNQNDIPNIYITPQGNVMNYARLYHVGDGQTIVRYYIDPSIDRLAVEDNQGHSYAINTIIRESVREGLLEWASAAQHQFSVEEVMTAERANLTVYGMPNSYTDAGGANAIGVTAGMPSIDHHLPGDLRTGRIYFFNHGIQVNFNIFLDPNDPVSQEFRTYTGINDPNGYLTYQLPLTSLHEIGHPLGFAHPDGPSAVGAGFTQRPLTDSLPSPMVPSTQIMLTTLDYLEARYQQLGHAVHRNDIEISIQERFALQLLWTRRNEDLHCQTPSSARALTLSTRFSGGCLRFPFGQPLIPSIFLLLGT